MNLLMTSTVEKLVADLISSDSKTGEML